MTEVSWQVRIVVNIEDHVPTNVQIAEACRRSIKLLFPEGKVRDSVSVRAERLDR
jgi:hypothetical protein